MKLSLAIRSFVYILGVSCVYSANVKFPPRRLPLQQGNLTVVNNQIRKSASGGVYSLNSTKVTDGHFKLKMPSTLVKNNLNLAMSGRLMQKLSQKSNQPGNSTTMMQVNHNLNKFTMYKQVESKLLDLKRTNEAQAQNNTVARNMSVRFPNKSQIKPMPQLFSRKMGIESPFEDLKPTTSNIVEILYPSPQNNLSKKFEIARPSKTRSTNFTNNVPHIVENTTNQFVLEDATVLTTTQKHYPVLDLDRLNITQLSNEDINAVAEALPIIVSSATTLPGEEVVRSTSIPAKKSGQQEIGSRKDKVFIVYAQSVKEYPGASEVVKMPGASDMLENETFVKNDLGTSLVEELSAEKKAPATTSTQTESDQNIRKDLEVSESSSGLLVFVPNTTIVLEQNPHENDGYNLARIQKFSNVNTKQELIAEIQESLKEGNQATQISIAPDISLQLATTSPYVPQYNPYAETPTPKNLDNNLPHRPNDTKTAEESTISLHEELGGSLHQTRQLENTPAEVIRQPLQYLPINPLNNPLRRFPTIGRHPNNHLDRNAMPTIPRNTIPEHDSHVPLPVRSNKNSMTHADMMMMAQAQNSLNMLPLRTHIQDGAGVTRRDGFITSGNQQKQLLHASNDHSIFQTSAVMSDGEAPETLGGFFSFFG